MDEGWFADMLSEKRSQSCKHCNSNQLRTMLFLPKGQVFDIRANFEGLLQQPSLTFIGIHDPGS